MAPAKRASTPSSPSLAPSRGAGSAPPAVAGQKFVWWAALVLVAATCAAYWNTFSVPLLLDDTVTIAANPSIHRLWPLGPVLSPPGEIPSSGRPLLNLSFALNYAFGGTEVRGYHAVNLAIHMAAGLLLFGLVRRTLGLAALRERFGAASGWLAFAAALLWLLHPLQTNSVTYLSQRAESLMGLCYLGTLYGFVRGAGSAHRGGWFALSVGCCLLGMATKEVMVTAPLLVLLYDRTWVSGTFRGAWRNHARLYAGLGATWALLLGLMLASPLRDRSVGFAAEPAWWSYALLESGVVLQYLKLAVWPQPLVFDYGLDWPPPGALQVASQLAGVGALLAATLVGLRRRPALGFLGAWFLVIVLPTSSVIPVSGQPMAENRMYLPLAAVIVAAVTVAWVLGRRAGLGALLAVAAGYLGLTVQRNADYRSDVTIWSDTVQKRPESSRAHHNLGEALRARGAWAEAAAQFEAALRINPNYAEAHNNLGNALSQMPGREAEAISHYEGALRLKPGYAEAHNNLGGILLRTPGRLNEAIHHLTRALELGFERAGVHFNLGLAWLNVPGRTESAIDHYTRGLRLDPNNVDAHNNLGIALANLPGRLPEAIAHHETALRLRPDDPLGHNNLANALLSVPARASEAVAHYRRAVELKPDYAEAHYNLGHSLLKTGGDRQEALVHFETALRLRPDLEQARAALSWLRSGRP